jgi:hypothetical protein
LAEAHRGILKTPCELCAFGPCILNLTYPCVLQVMTFSAKDHRGAINAIKVCTRPTYSIHSHVMRREHSTIHALSRSRHPITKHACVLAGDQGQPPVRECLRRRLVHHMGPCQEGEDPGSALFQMPIILMWSERTHPSVLVGIN